MVSMAPMGGVPVLISNAAGDPPKMMGAPGRANRRMTMPLRFSAVSCTSAPAKVTGAAAPARGMEIRRRGCLPGGVDEVLAGQVAPFQGRRGGQQSSIAQGFSERPFSPPGRPSDVLHDLEAPTAKVPVMIGFVQNRSPMYSRYLSCMASGTSMEIMSVLCAAMFGKGVRQDRETDEIPGHRLPFLQGHRIQDLQGPGARVEVDGVPFQGHRESAAAVIHVDRPRRGLERRFNEARLERYDPPAAGTSRVRQEAHRFVVLTRTPVFSRTSTASETI